MSATIYFTLGLIIFIDINTLSTMRNITIKGREYVAKYSIRALFIWESIADRRFEQKSLMDQLLFFYSILLANNKNVISWDEFLDAVDEDATIVVQFTEILMEHQKVQDLLDGEEDEEGNKKKQ